MSALIKTVITIVVFFISIQLSAQDLSELDSIAKSLNEHYGIKGIALTGVKGNSILYAKGFGKANESHNISTSTPLYIASNTKAFIGLAVYQLIRQQEISLDDPMIKYIDRSHFPKEIEVESITIKDLLGHSHGLSNDPLTFRTSSSGEYPDNLEQLLKFTKYYPDGNTLVKRHRYSNLGYLLLGIIIEKVTGLHWKVYLKKNILEPLELRNTQPYLPKGELLDKMTLPYNFSKKMPLKQVKKDNTLHAAGGLYSNLEDMGRWLKLFTGTAGSASDIIPKPGTDFYVPLAQTENNLGPIKISGYGYGWYFGELFGNEFVFHTGEFSGSASFMSFMPDKEIGFFAFTNESSNLYRSILQIILVYYAILTENPGKDKINGMMTDMTKKAYENYEESEQILLKRNENSFIPMGKFIHEAYGTLVISTGENGYKVNFGNNLWSAVYKGESDNEFTAEFVPGSIERFRVENENAGIRIKYGDYEGYFYPED